MQICYDKFNNEVCGWLIDENHVLTVWGTHIDTIGKSFERDIDLFDSFCALSLPEIGEVKKVVPGIQCWYILKANGQVIKIDLEVRNSVIIDTDIVDIAWYEDDLILLEINGSFVVIAGEIYELPEYCTNIYTRYLTDQEFRVQGESGKYYDPITKLEADFNIVDYLKIAIVSEAISSPNRLHYQSLNKEYYAAYTAEKQLLIRSGDDIDIIEYEIV